MDLPNFLTKFLKKVPSSFDALEYQEERLNRAVCLQNISNFCYLVELYTDNHPEKEAIKKALRTYIGKPSFSLTIKDGKRTFCCKIQEALKPCLGDKDYAFLTTPSGSPEKLRKTVLPLGNAVHKEHVGGGRRNPTLFERHGNGGVSK